ncbi:SAM-dependent methyltransferase [Cellulomonas pakistanensis]|uniref:Methyltransferase type 12 n=1 Tax=Cellulomonas pakistanensis TaxID=992287 RepID=A0A919U643_9CELL|nr:methyltransferase domain-containing protein [Cellulomonas pakistanensis]GIG35890.1 methyltransferase type 12 [Cellulomonas pakistanensis]
MPELSPRLRGVVDALPLRPGLRVLEVGGAPGAAAREVAERVGPGGHVLVLDRSEAGIARTREACRALVEAGRLSTLCAPVEDFALPPGTAPFDLAFACRVGALDGRHPRLRGPALGCLRAALVPGGVLLVDTGDPLAVVRLDGHAPAAGAP